jgi:hypothetical protein
MLLAPMIPSPSLRGLMQHNAFVYRKFFVFLARHDNGYA